MKMLDTLDKFLIQKPCEYELFCLNYKEEKCDLKFIRSCEIRMDLLEVD